MPMLTNLSANGAPAVVASLTVTWKLLPYMTDAGGGVVNVSCVAAGGGPGGVVAFPGIEPGM